jgi:cell division protein FtsL
VTAILPFAGFVLLAAALCGLATANVLASHARRKLLASNDMLLAARDGQIDAYQKLIAAQAGLIKAQTVLIRAHEERAAALGLPSRRPSKWGTPLQ